MRRNSKLIKYILILTLFLSIFSTIGAAGTQSNVLATKTIDFKEHSHLIEWFSSTDCNKCRTFENENSNSDYTWINWFNSENDKINNLARDDTNKRLNQLNETNFPLLVVDGDIIYINHNDSVDTWKGHLNKAIEQNKHNEGFVNISLDVDIIDTTGDNRADGIRLYGEITPLSNLHNDTAIHVHIVENIADADGSGARPYISNVLREWVPRMDFSVENGNTTEWEYTLSETYLESAEINLNYGNSNRYSVVISIHGSDLANSTEMRVLAVKEDTLPSIHEQRGWMNFPLILLGNIILISGIAFIVIQERIREGGLPLIEGRIIDSKVGEKKINLNFKTGNKKVEVLGLEVNKGWRTSRLPQLPIISPKSTLDLEFRAITKGKSDSDIVPLQITVKTEVEDLGQWMMDIDMILEKNE
jgi:hypothetical protein